MKELYLVLVILYALLSTAEYQSAKQFGSRSGLRLVRTHLGPNCLLRLSVKDTSRQIVSLD